MTTAFGPRVLFLFAGDIVFFYISLWLAIFLRAFEVPPQWYFTAHLLPFSLLYIAWIAVYVTAGLYENRSVILARRALSATLLIAQSINMVLAALFFFSLPVFIIAPKTMLLIYLPVSFCLVLLWRVYLFPLLGLQKTEPAVLVGEGPEMQELERAMNRAHRAPVQVVAALSPATPNLSSAILDAMVRHEASVVVADFDDTRVSDAFPQVYNLLSVGVRFVDALGIYEELFGRIPLSRLDERWLARNVSLYAHTLYDTLKRMMDLLIALPATLLSLLLYPFIALAIKFDDGGPVFIWQERVGQGGALIRIPKFRSMQRNDMDLAGASHKTNRVTSVGRFIRATRLDELPQLWSVLSGDLALIGPRPELPSGVALYEKEIPYYGVRHLIKPGLSGWAVLFQQDDPHHGVGVSATRTKLSYDIYYLKHRSLFLDLSITLKTIKKLLTRSGV